MSKEMMRVADVAEYLDVTDLTVWRWCREGILPCIKVGREWRIRRAALEEFLEQGERSNSVVGRLRAFLEVPDNVLGIAQSVEWLHRLDAAFFKVGEARGGKLFKFLGNEPVSEGELRTDLGRNGLEVSGLERESRLHFSEEADRIDQRTEVLQGLLEDEANDGWTLWASFDWAKELDENRAIEQQSELTELIGSSGRLVVKTALLEEDTEGWPSAAYRKAQMGHSGVLWLSEQGLATGRATRVEE